MSKKEISNASALNWNLLRNWIIISAILFLSYILEVVKGTRTPVYLVVFCCILYIPFFISLGLYIKNRGSKLFLLGAISGYLIFYTFVLFTSNNLLTFVYVFPMLFVYTAFNNTRAMAITGIYVVVINVTRMISFQMSAAGSENAMADYEIELVCIALCTFMSISSIRLTERIFKARESKILEDESSLKSVLNQMKQVAGVVTVNAGVMTKDASALQDSNADICSAMNEITSGMEQCVEMVELQMTKTSTIQTGIEQTASVSNEVKVLADLSAESIHTGQDSIDKLLSSAKNIEVRSNEMSDCMRELLAVSSQMKEITEIISSIATSTNLLALNASIEAARAGDAGKGFAVVANEVNKLATETAGATRSIKGMIDTLEARARDIDEKTLQVADLNKTQNNVIYEVNKVFVDVQQHVSSVSAKSAEQTVAMSKLVEANKDIVESINNISAISEEVTASVSQTQEVVQKNLTSSTEMSQLAEELAAEANKLVSSET